MQSLLVIALLIVRVTWSLTPPRPNLLLMLADDMGWGDFGINVPHLPSNTPHLDAIARKGLRLTDFHSGSSVCSPSRAALLTGRLGLRTGTVANFASSAKAGLPREETILAEVLKKAGYRTAMLGKWHLGTSEGFHPVDRGFDTYLGVPYSLDMGCTSPPGLDFPPAMPCSQNDQFSTTSLRESRFGLPLYHDHKITHQPVALKDLAKLYMTFGEHFILENSSQPFFLYAAFSHVHVPIAIGPQFQNATGRGIFADALKEMDSVANRLVRAANSKQNSSTLTWFLSDNGPWEVKCSLAGQCGTFSGEWQRSEVKGGGGSAAKFTTWEGGHRVPAFLHWPGKIKKGQISNALLSAMDILPTFADLAGAQLPIDRTLDGISIAQDLLRDTHNISGHKVLFHPNSGSAGTLGEIGAVRVGRHKAVYYAGGAASCAQPASAPRRLRTPLVFDLLTDPSEATPLQNSSVKGLVLRLAGAALARLRASIQADHTSTTDYRKDPAAQPCCDQTRLACSCPGDLLICV